MQILTRERRREACFSSFFYWYEAYYGSCRNDVLTAISVRMNHVEKESPMALTRIETRHRAFYQLKTGTVLPYRDALGFRKANRDRNLPYLGLQVGIKNFEHLDGRGRDSCSGAKDCGYTSFVEEVVVLGGNDTSGCDEDVLAAEFLELGDDLGNQSLMASGERADAKDVDVVFDCLASGFGRGLEQRAHVDVEAAVGVAGGYDFGSAVVTVLTHLGDHNSGLATFLLCESLAHLLGFDEVGVMFSFV